METSARRRVAGGGCLRDSASQLALGRAYLLAKQQVITAGFEEEIAWQEEATLQAITPITFVREAAWVVLCAGMRESTIRARFERLGSSFAMWDPEGIALNANQCRRDGLRVFNHTAKLDAIIHIAVDISRLGIQFVVDGVGRDGPPFLRRFPYIGPVTCYHLAKNMGCAVAKPDRHLQRIAASLGFAGASDLCSVIAEVLDEPIQVVDVVLWRFAATNRDYIRRLQQLIALPNPGTPRRA